MNALPKQKPFFQGNDWYTSRWIAAQAFDSLDRLQDLCLCRDNSPPPEDDETEDLLDELSAVLDDLVAEIGLALADILATPAPQPASRWKAFEMRLYLDTARETLEAGPPEGTDFFETLFDLFSQAKATLKALDHQASAEIATA